jgi:hypothetical protein
MVNDPTVQAVLDKFTTRSNTGMIKYKVSMKDNPGNLVYWLLNLQEELQDAVLYIERILEEIRKDK